MAVNFPLDWPGPIPRRPPPKRQQASFRHRGQFLSVAKSLIRLDRELRLVKAKNIVVSTNIEIRLDGLPYSNRRKPDDPGVAIYFWLQGKPHCMPCDLWDRTSDNLAAVAKHIEAIRGMERWGVGDIMTAFAGFKALPAPGSQRPWRDVLGVGSLSHPTINDAESQYRILARHNHPDRGGDPGRMAEINVAIGMARKEFGEAAHG